MSRDDAIVVIGSMVLMLIGLWLLGIGFDFIDSM